MRIITDREQCRQHQGCIPYPPTREQLHDDGRIDGIPVVTPDEWERRRWSYAERAPKIFRTGRVFGCGQKGNAVRCKETNHIYHSVNAATVAMGKHPCTPGISQAARTKGMAFGFHWEYVGQEATE